MREISINGYIDDEAWWGDEITPEALRAALYGANGEHIDDVHIRLCSYGGSCNAATRMYDYIRAYPGHVTITVSGTAASAGTVLATAADRLEMTPGSLFMIHDPSTFSWGNERDLSEAVNLLRACKESILNVYGKRCKKPRDEIAGMMTAATWMDAGQALADGFIDGIADDTRTADPTNAAQPRTVNRIEAEAKVQAWLDRHNPVKRYGRIDATEIVTSHSRSERKQPDGVAVCSELTPNVVQVTKVVTIEPPASEQITATTIASEPENPGTPIAQLEHRLGLIMPTRRK